MKDDCTVESVRERERERVRHPKESECEREVESEKDRKGERERSKFFPFHATKIVLFSFGLAFLRRNIAWLELKQIETKLKILPKNRFFRQNFQFFDSCKKLINFSAESRRCRTPEQSFFHRSLESNPRM